jgi:alanine racemase
LKTRSGAPRGEATAGAASGVVGGPAPGPAWAQIDLDALAANARLLRLRVGPRCRLMPVVKADAYGHGAAEVVRRLADEGIDALCVAWPQEGISARRAGFEGMILVLGPTASEGLEACLASKLTPTLFDAEGLQALERLAAQRGERPGFHLKIDTGMGRLGLPPEALAEWLGLLGRCRHVLLEGVCSHLASVESVRGDTSRLQLERFQSCLSEMSAAGHTRLLRHLAASSAVLDLPDAWLDAVRPGVSLYGVHPAHSSTRIGLRPVMSVRARVAAVREHPAGSPLGYEGTFVTRRRSRIAVVAMGYADGLPRAHSNRGCVVLGGHRVPIVGLVSMDLTLIDVTDVPAVSPGDEVILFGEEGRGRPLEEFARDASLSPYEILCSIGLRLPRQYRVAGGVVSTRPGARADLGAAAAAPAPSPSAR